MKYIEEFEHPQLETLTGSIVHLNIKNNYPELFEYVNTNKGSYRFTEFLYRMYHHIDSDPVCAVCGAPVRFKTLHLGYARTCGRACTAKDSVAKEKSKETMIRKYGVDNISKLESMQTAKRERCIEKYGVDSPNKVDAIKKKQHKPAKPKPPKKTPKEKKISREKTMMERHGVKHWTNREKCRQTTKARYGVESLFQSPEFQDKIRDIKLKKYGNKYYTNREKYKRTSLEKYGVEWGFNTPEAQEKARQTTIDRYGVPFTFMSKEVQDYVHSPEIKEKAIKTNLEKYGVPYFCLSLITKKGTNNSKPNIKFAKILDSLNIKYEREFVLGKYAYDFKVGNLLIEINPTATHNVDWSPYGTPVSKTYHTEKSNYAINEYGYNVVCIWDWDDYEKVIHTFISEDHTKYYGRKCVCKEVDKQTAIEFIKLNHLQGSCRGISVSIGIYHHDELVGIMCWGKPRYNKNYSYELLRLCYKPQINVVGGTKKMFDFFIDKYRPESLISYCDLSKFNGSVYNDLGFVRQKNTQPSIHWVNNKKIHITNNLLNQRGFDQIFGTNYGKGTSNEQLMIDHGFVRVYDCGQATFVWNNPDL